MDRRLVRQTFEARFSISQMAGNYLKVYEQLLHKNPTKKRRRHETMSFTTSLQKEPGNTRGPRSDSLQPRPDKPQDTACGDSQPA